MSNFDLSTAKPVTSEPDPIPPGRVLMHVADTSASSPQTYVVTNWTPDAANPDLMRPVAPGCRYDLTNDNGPCEVVFEFADGKILDSAGTEITSLRDWYDAAHLRLAARERGAALIH